MQKNIFTLSMLALASLGLFSCGTNEQDALVATVNLQTRTEIQSETTSPGVVSGANLLNATIRIREVGLVQPTNPITQSIGISDGSVQQITLLNSGLPTSPTNFGSAVVNHGEYDRLILRLERGSALPEGDPMRNRSLLISGTVNNRILNIHTDSEEIVTAVLGGGPYTITSDENLVLSINLNRLFHDIDLTEAQDGDGDGTIQIEPSNIDGNRLLYNQMVNNLPTAFSVTRQ